MPPARPVHNTAEPGEERSSRAGGGGGKGGDGVAIGFLFNSRQIIMTSQLAGKFKLNNEGFF